MTALRRAETGDVADLQRLAAEESIAAFLATDTVAGIPAAVQAGEYFMVSEDGRARGAVRLAIVNRRSRIGDVRALIVDPAHRGRGLGVAIVRGLCGLAFGAMGLHRVETQVYAFNTAAIATFERAGFTQEGVRRQAFDRRGGWQDGIYFGRLADDPEGDPT